MKKIIQPLVAVKMKRRLTLLLLATAGTAGAAVINVHPSWERWDPIGSGGTVEHNQYAIYAEWEFAADTNPVGPDNEAAIDINPIHCTMCPNEAAIPTVAIWSAGDGTGQWNFPNLPGQIDGFLTNVVDDLPLKLVQTAITWYGEEANAPTFVITGAFDHSIPPTGTIPIDGGSIDNYNYLGHQTLVDDYGTSDPTDDKWVGIYNSEIRPNPDNELFRIDMRVGTSIDGFTIDTISIPEPGNAMLLGLLCCSGFFLRSRRS